ncbi:MAG TPA: hypothetical protein VFR37_05110, partial [Longimicrobium sp.]|nr:hypothetical protein [Longimicrobium sp.]
PAAPRQPEAQLRLGAGGRATSAATQQPSGYQAAAGGGSAGDAEQGPSLLQLEARAQAAASGNAEARSGLHSFRTSIARHSPVTRRNILASVPPELMESFLGILNAGGFLPARGERAQWYQVLARNATAHEFIRQFGRDGVGLLYRFMRLQGQGTDAVQLARAAPDLARALRASPQARAALLRAYNQGSLQSLAALDTALGIPRETPAVSVAPLPSDPQWGRYLAEATRFARRHSQLSSLLRPENREHLEQLAALYRTLEIAPGYSGLPHRDRVALLDNFDQQAASIPGMLPIWVNRHRGELAELLFAPPLSQDAARRVYWQGGRVIPAPTPGQGVSGYTVLDYAIPQVSLEEAHSGNVRPREWVEMKSDMIDTGIRDAVGVYRAGRSAAERYLSDAVADLGNLPTGHSLSLHFVRDPGEATREAMLRIFARNAGIRRVGFGEQWYDPARYRAQAE